jgi:bacterioferritin-associated ferredoxin
MGKTAKQKNLSTAEQIAEAFRNLAELFSTFEGAEPSEPDEDEDEEVEEDDEEEEDEGEGEEVTRADVEAAAAEGIKSLRELAKQVGIEATKKADILAEFDEMLGEEDEDEDEDDEVEDVEEDEDEEGEDEWDRDSLEELDLKELRKVARDEGHSASDYKGMDEDALISLILGDEDEEEDEDEDEEADEVEADEEVLDEDALNEMSQKDLVALAKELDVKVSKSLQTKSKANHKKLVALILDSGEEE